MAFDEVSEILRHEDDVESLHFEGASELLDFFSHLQE